MNTIIPFINNKPGILVQETAKFMAPFSHLFAGHCRIKSDFMWLCYHN